MKKEKLIRRLEKLSAETVLVKPHGKEAKEIKLGDLKIGDLKINKDVALIPFKGCKGTLSICIKDLAKITA